MAEVEGLLQNAIDGVGAAGADFVTGDHKHRLQRRLAFDLDSQLGAADEGHDAVGQNNVEIALREDAKGLGAVVGFDDGMVVTAQEFAQDFPDGAFVLDQQDSFF